MLNVRGQRTVGTYGAIPLGKIFPDHYEQCHGREQQGKRVIRE